MRRTTITILFIFSLQSEQLDRTGLGLAYDIIKVHGGEIKVNTKECEGSEFIIQLPINE